MDQGSPRTPRVQGLTRMSHITHKSYYIHDYGFLWQTDTDENQQRQRHIGLSPSTSSQLFTNWSPTDST